MPSIFDVMPKKKDTASSESNRVSMQNISDMMNNYSDADVVELNLDDLHDMPGNDYFFPTDPNVIENLKREIRSSGYNDYIVVSKDDDGSYSILSGHQRRLALLGLGWKKAKCIVRKNLSEQEKRDFFISANVTVRRLTPLSIARLVDDSIKTFKERKKKDPAFEHFGDSREYAATRLGISRTKVHKYLAILEMPEDIQERCSDPDFPFTALYDARKFTDEQKALLSDKLKQRDIEHPNLIFTSKDIEGFLSEIIEETSGDKKATSENEAGGSERGEFLKNPDSKDQAFRKYQQQLAAEIEARKDPVIIDEELNAITRQLYTLVSGQMLVHDNDRIRNDAKIIELCVKNIEKLINKKQ